MNKRFVYQVGNNKKVKKVTLQESPKDVPLHLVMHNVASTQLKIPRRKI